MPRFGMQGSDSNKKEISKSNPKPANSSNSRSTSINSNSKPNRKFVTFLNENDQNIR